MKWVLNIDNKCGRLFIYCLLCTIKTFGIFTDFLVFL